MRPLPVPPSNHRRVASMMPAAGRIGQSGAAAALTALPAANKWAGSMSERRSACQRTSSYRKPKPRLPARRQSAVAAAAEARTTSTAQMQRQPKKTMPAPSGKKAALACMA
jgi:hypothetical protein